MDGVIHVITVNVRNCAQALNCEEPEDLFNYLSFQHLSDTPAYVRKPFGIVLWDSTLPTTLLLFQTTILCQKCHRVGHNTGVKWPTRNFRVDQLTTRIKKESNPTAEWKTSTIFTSNNDNNKFYKKTVIYGQHFVVYVDFGCKCSLLREFQYSKI